MLRFLITLCMIGLSLPLQLGSTELPSGSKAAAVSRQLDLRSLAILPWQVHHAIPLAAIQQSDRKPSEIAGHGGADRDDSAPFPPHLIAAPKHLRHRIPDRLVVLTFDDAPLTHATLVAPILHKYHFGATFYICEFPPNFKDKSKYMSWEQIKKLDKMGFEIGNHTARHTHVSRISRDQFEKALAYIEDACRSYGIRKPTTFAYPGYDARSKDLDVLTERGYTFARAGLERPYDPLADSPLLVPGFNANGADPAHVVNVIQQAHDGKIVVLIFHGVPDYEHPWVNTPPELFARYMEYLHKNHYKVIAMRDLARYFDASGKD